MTVSAGGGDSRDGGHSGQRERPIGSERLSPQLCKLVIWHLSSVANTRCAATIAARSAAMGAEPTNTDPTYLPSSPSIVHRTLKAMVVDLV